MVKISPIFGITYNQASPQIKIDDVIAPPYDVISDEEQNELYNKSPYNIVRLILNKEEAGDNETSNKYTRAGSFFRQWQQGGELVKSQKPCIYYYVQNYTTPKGKKISRKGFIANTFIEDFSSKNVLPHEYTMGGPKQDRLNLMKQCDANFSQIFMIYSDPQREIESIIEVSGKPFIDAVDSQNVQNIVYIIDDEKIISGIQKILSDKTLLIADGHHRYETAIAFRDYMKELNPDAGEEAPFNYVMSYFTNMDDENLIVYPTHRIVTKNTDSSALITKLGELFEVSEFVGTRQEFINEVESLALSQVAFGLCVKDSGKSYTIKASKVKKINEILAGKEVPEVLRDLDLTVLHKIVIGDFININDDDQMSQTGIKYIKKEEEAFEALDNGEANLVFVMATPQISKIKDVSQAGFRMPQKSTYFYPKLVSGLVINPLN